MTRQLIAQTDCTAERFNTTIWHKIHKICCICRSFFVTAERSQSPQSWTSDLATAASKWSTTTCHCVWHSVSRSSGVKSWRAEVTSSNRTVKHSEAAVSPTVAIMARSIQPNSEHNNLICTSDDSIDNFGLLSRICILQKYTVNHNQKLTHSLLTKISAAYGRVQWLVWRSGNSFGHINKASYVEPS